MKPGHIDAKRMVISVIGKGNKQRLVPMNVPLLARLRLVWTLHRNPEWVFATRPLGNPVSYSAVGNALRDAAKSTGLSGVTSHVFRHSFATRILEVGASVQTVQILLGHADPKTTQTYLHLTEPLRQDIRRSMEAFTDDLTDL